MTGEAVSVFVAEDEPLLKMLLTDMLLAAGYKLAGAASTVAEAASFAVSVKADLALLDVTLFDQAIFPAAAILRARNIAIIFCTGYSGEALPDEWRECRILRKPFTDIDLMEVIGATLSADQQLGDLGLPRKAK